MGGTKAARDMVKETLKRVTLKPSEADGENVILTSVWHASDMLEGIARRIMWRYDEDGTEHYDAQIATTREMLEAGLTVNNGHANWAIPRPKPVEASTWTCRSTHGAWRMARRRFEDGRLVRLGPDERGSGPCAAASGGGRLRGARCGGGQAYPRHRPPPPAAPHGIIWRQAHPRGVLQRSVEQRLELVRGLLDQDGTIDPRTHGIEFCQSLDHKPIVDGLVRLLRSLGVIVHEPSRSQAGYRDADGTYHRTQDRLRVTFTTDLPVFSLPRKKALLPRETRETADWLYVRSIRRVPDEPHRCLSIESPDHTYLVGGYIPTHNTRVLLHLAAQWGRLPNPDDRKSTIPIVFFDPKPNSSDFGPFVKSMGGMLVRLDSPEAEGILDPVRCIPWTMKDMIVQTAVEMLSQITGGRDADRSRDLALTSIIGYGLRHGADCTGEAVRIAYKAHQEGGEDADRIDPLVDEITPMLERQATNSSMFKLIYGTRHGGRRLAVSDGLTLLSAGTMNIISEKEADSGPSDIQRWVVRMAALGASASIIGRNGVLVVDEAWSLLGDRFGVSVVNRMGRLARDQHYMPVFASQKVTEFVEAGLQDFMGRGIAMAMAPRRSSPAWSRRPSRPAACSDSPRTARWPNA